MTEYTVEFVGTGETITISDKDTVLKRCIEEGIAQEYSCRVGMCLACSAEIVEGEVTQPAARGLTEEERERYAGGSDPAGRTRADRRGTRTLRVDLHGPPTVRPETRPREVPAEYRGRRRDRRRRLRRGRGRRLTAEVGRAQQSKATL